MTQLSVLTNYHGVDVLDVPELVPPIREGLKACRYERKEIAAGLALFQNGDRIVEMGAGIGVVGAVMAKNIELGAILAVEPNYRLVPRIRQLYSHNGLAQVLEVAQTLVFSEPDPPDTAEFLVRVNFLGSGMTITRGHERAERIDVPVTPWAAIKSTFKPNALMMDIEGAELDFFRHADLSGIDRIVFEIHRKVYGRDGVQELRRLLNTAGFTMSELSGCGVHAYERIS